jgi:hypothetical protein
MSTRVETGAPGQRARKVARGDEVGWLGRIGLSAQGTIYILVALLALQVAVDGRDSAGPPNKQGALQLVKDQPLGTWLLALLGIGFAAYALWRMAQAFADREGKGDDAKGLATRAGYFAVGIWYGSLAFLVAERLFGSGGSSSEGSKATSQTAGVLGHPFGRELVFAVAAGFAAGAGWNIYRAFSGKLRKRLDGSGLSERGRKVAIAVGAFGHVARGVVFGVIAWFLAKAAWQFDPKEARSLDRALLEIARADYGPILLGAVAVGLMAFGAWCLLQAAYRDV